MNAREKFRGRIVFFVFVIYWLLIFEGALRKWAFPQYHQILFFIRDPFVLYVYWMALRGRFFPSHIIFRLGILLAALFIPLIFYQVVVLNINFLTLLYGWRMYFYLIPLTFVIMQTFSRTDVHRLIVHTLYIAVPISILVYVQYISPPNSLINQAYGSGTAFVVWGNTVRTTGTFTFNAGQAMFVGSVVAMAVFAWLNPSRMKLMPLPLLLLVTVAVLVILLLSGSRTAFFLAGLVVIATLLGVLLIRDMKSKVAALSMLMVLMFVGALAFLGPLRSSYDNLVNRFASAERSEGSAIRRALAPFYLFYYRMDTTPALGHGLGYGTGGGSKLATGRAKLVLAEDEWSRIIMEAGPALGLIYITYRGFLTFILFRRAIVSARTDDYLLPLILFGFIGYYVFNGQATHQGTMSGYTWIFVGLILASSRKNVRAL